MMQPNTTPDGLSQAAQLPSMSDHLVRVGHLKAIMKANKWGKSELGRQCKRTPQQVGSWFSNKRRIGERLARELEAALGLGRGALDLVEPGRQAKEPSAAFLTTQRPRVSAKNRAKEVPVLVWTDIRTMLDADNSALKHKATHLETFAVSSARAKFLEMPDDSMSPEITIGDHVLFDPAEAPRAGDVVLVGLPGGENFVRVFRPRTAYVFEAAPVNPAYQPVSSQQDGAVVLAVMVEHRRYRRSL